MKNLEKVFTKAEYINHVNFSGMNFGKLQIQEVLELVSRSPYLLSIHLNDNGIAQCNKGLAT